MLQSDLSMKGHVARTVSRCFCQLRLRKGCIKSLPFETARAAVNCRRFTSQVDRCNSLLVGAPKRLLDCLHSVLNPSGCCAIVESTITLHRYSMMFCTGSQYCSSSHRVQSLLASIQVAPWGGARVLARLLHRETLICFGVATSID